MAFMFYFSSRSASSRSDKDGRRFMAHGRRAASRLWVSGAFLVLAFGLLSGCDDADQTPRDPQVAHCEEAAKRLSRDYGSEITINSVSAWEDPTTRTITISFATAGDGQRVRRHYIKCTYAPLPQDRPPPRQVQASAVEIDWRQLSRGELTLLNNAIARPR